MFSLGITLLIIFKMYVPTSSQVSAPWKDPIVTSNMSCEFVFIHGVLLWCSIVCFAWTMIFLSRSVILVNFLAKSSAFSRNCSVIDG